MARISLDLNEMTSPGAWAGTCAFGGNAPEINVQQNTKISVPAPRGQSDGSDGKRRRLARQAGLFYSSLSVISTLLRAVALPVRCGTPANWTSSWFSPVGQCTGICLQTDVLLLQVWSHENRCLAIAQPEQIQLTK